MADIVFIAVVVAFFAVCVLYVRWCDRIIGADEPSSATIAPAADQPEQTDQTGTVQQEVAA